MDINAPIPPEQSLIEYPSQFPIKVMGEQVDGFIDAIAHVARQFDPTFDPSSIELRPSKGGKYLGLTITVTVICCVGEVFPTWRQLRGAG